MEQQETIAVTADPNHEEFQSRYDEHSMVFDAMLEIKNAMLSEDRQREIAKMLVDSFCGD